MDPLLVWGLILLAAAFLLVVLELFVPSAGALGVTAAVLAIAAIICMFRADAVWGVSSLLAVLILGPATIGFALRIWPSTPMGRRIIGVPSDEEVEKQRIEEEEQRKRYAAMVGQEGVVLTDLRPVGVVEIQGKRYDALSETLFVPTGSRVRVTHFDGVQVKVRQA